MESYDKWWYGPSVTGLYLCISDFRLKLMHVLFRQQFIWQVAHIDLLNCVSFCSSASITERYDHTCDFYSVDEQQQAESGFVFDTHNDY